MLVFTRSGVTGEAQKENSYYDYRAKHRVSIRKTEDFTFILFLLDFYVYILLRLMLFAQLGT